MLDFSRLTAVALMAGGLLLASSAHAQLVEEPDPTRKPGGPGDGEIILPPPEDGFPIHPPGQCGKQPIGRSETVPCPSPQTGTIIRIEVFDEVPAPTCWVSAGMVEIQRTCANPPPQATGNPRIDPTGQLGQGRNLGGQPSQNDRFRPDSTVAGAMPVSLPNTTVTQPTCGDPTALNFGQIGPCIYGPPPTPPPSCPPRPASETRTLSCPAPQTGSIIEGRSYNAAPEPTCWVAGPWTQITNTCSGGPVGCGPQPPSEDRTVACPSGQSGFIFETRSWSAAPEPTCWVQGAWVETSRTCAATCAGVPQPGSESDTVPCTPPLTGQVFRTRSYVAAPAPQCWAPGPWTEISNTCAGPCPPQPEPEERVLSCPSGFVGQIRERRIFENAPAPTCWAPGPWSVISDTCEPDLGPDLGCGPGRPAPIFRWSAEQTYSAGDDCRGRWTLGALESSIAPYSGTSCTQWDHENLGPWDVPIFQGCISDDTYAEYHAFCQKQC